MLGVLFFFLDIWGGLLLLLLGSADGFGLSWVGLDWVIS